MKSHNKDVGNELVDEMAKIGATEGRGFADKIYGRKFQVPEWGEEQYWELLGVV